MNGAASWIGPAIVAAVISALVTGLGWLVSERQAFRREARLRRERVVDIQVALLADIRAAEHQADEAQTATDAVLEQMSTEADFVPFVPRRPDSIILNAILSDLQALPTAVVDPVVLYYQQIAALRMFVEDLRSDRFATFEPPRRRDMYQDYAAMLGHAARLGKIAADAVRTSLNTRVAGGFGP